ncbi:MAG: hypothetical protein H7336_03175 [Bacteriovorax sp.]|nr:hypothetical protein [Bacteriovorax sp.]
MTRSKLGLTILLISLNFLSTKTYAFHRVTEILPEKNLLICKDSNQVKVGNKVEIYAKRLPNSRNNLEMVKASELTLPAEGQKIDLYHREFHFSGKILSKYHDEKIGSATVIALDLAGKERKYLVQGKLRSSKMEEKIEKLTSEEALKLKNNCILATPDQNTDITELTSIVF